MSFGMDLLARPCTCELRLRCTLCATYRSTDDAFVVSAHPRRYRFGSDFDASYGDTPGVTVSQWVKYRESFCHATLPIPAFDVYEPLEDRGRSAACVLAIEELVRRLVVALQR